MLAWRITWALLGRTTPKPFKKWRLLLLRLYGCTIHGNPFVSESAKIRIPWQLTLHDRSCIGEHAEVYNLGHVTLEERCVVAQHVYLCGGTHDLNDPNLPLMTGPIVIGQEAFVGAKAVVLPGVKVGRFAVVGAGAVVAKSVPDHVIVAGNPAKPIGERRFNEY